MRECWNWQTGQTKDLVVIAIVWVQVPSPAWMKHKKDEVLPRLFCVLFMRLRLMNPWVQGLASGSVGAQHVVRRTTCTPSPAVDFIKPKGSRSRLRLGRCTTCDPPDHVHSISHSWLHQTQGFKVSAPVGAEPTSTGCRAPHLPRLRLMNLFNS